MKTIEEIKQSIITRFKDEFEYYTLCDESNENIITKWCLLEDILQDEFGMTEKEIEALEDEVRAECRKSGSPMFDELDELVNNFTVANLCK